MRKLTLLLLLLMSMAVMAAPRRYVPAYPGEIKRVQANGDTLSIYMRGDERGHMVVTTDGYELIQWGNSYYYAQYKKGQLVRSDRLAQNPDRRSKKDRCWLRRKGIRYDQKHN